MMFKSKATITKGDLIQSISNSYGISAKLCEDYTNLLIKEIESLLVLKKRVKIKNFGIFEFYSKNKRIGRNPKNMEEYDITERNKVKFIAAKKLRAEINHE